MEQSLGVCPGLGVWGLAGCLLPSSELFALLAVRAAMPQGFAFQFYPHAALALVPASHTSEVCSLKLLMPDASSKKPQNPSCSCTKEPFGLHLMAVEVRLQNQHSEVPHRALTYTLHLERLVLLSKNPCTVHDSFLGALQSVLWVLWDRSFLQIAFSVWIFFSPHAFYL